MADLPPGVPPLPFGVQSLFLTPISFLTADTYTGYGAGAPTMWGIFKDGRPVVVADTVLSMAYKQDWAIADYPVERGGFQSYDKVNTPYMARVQLASGGSVQKRRALLESIVAIADTLERYDVVTPEAIYTSVNVQHYDYRRTSRNGLGLMVIDVWLLEIREENTGNFKSTKSPSGYQPAEAGNVQAQPPSEAAEGAAAGDRAEAP